MKNIRKILASSLAIVLSSGSIAAFAQGLSTTSSAGIYVVVQNEPIPNPEPVDPGTPLPPTLPQIPPNEIGGVGNLVFEDVNLHDIVVGSVRSPQLYGNHPVFQLTNFLGGSENFTIALTPFFIGNTPVFAGSELALRGTRVFGPEYVNTAPISVNLLSNNQPNTLFQGLSRDSHMFGFLNSHLDIPAGSVQGIALDQGRVNASAELIITNITGPTN